MNRVPTQEATDLVNRTLGPFLQVGGLFVLIGGAWIFMFEYTGGVPLRLNDLGPEVMMAGFISLVVGTLMIWISTDDLRHDEQLRLLRLTPQHLSKSALAQLIKSPKSAPCPGCGYENRTDSFFCRACNSPLWPAGTPTGPPPEKSIVERRIRRTIAFRRAKRILVIVILAIAISTPFAVTLAAGYMAVNDSTLTIYEAQLDPNSSPVNQTLTIEWHLDSPWGTQVHLTDTTFRIVAHNLVLTAYPGCPDNPTESYGMNTVLICVLVIPHINETQLIGSTLTLTVLTTAHFFAYEQHIARSASTTI